MIQGKSVDSFVKYLNLKYWLDEADKLYKKEEEDKLTYDPRSIPDANNFAI